MLIQHTSRIILNFSHLSTSEQLNILRITNRKLIHMHTSHKC
jgi:hypothetical protein